jgi:hypothetical protein
MALGVNRQRVAKHRHGFGARDDLDRNHQAQVPRDCREVIGSATATKAVRRILMRLEQTFNVTSGPMPGRIACDKAKGTLFADVAAPSILAIRMLLAHLEMRDPWDSAKSKWWSMSETKMFVNGFD